MKRTKGRKLAVALLAVFMLLAGCSGNSKAKHAFRTTGIEQLNAGDYDSAIQSFDQALAKSGRLVGEFEMDVLKYRAEAEAGAGDYKAAAHTYEILCQVEEEKPEYLYRISMLYGKMGMAAECLEEYKKAYEQKPGAPEAKQALLVAGQALAEAERFEEAMELYTQAMNGGMESGELYNRMGVCELDAENYDKALEYFEKGMLLGDENCRGELLYHQALVYEKKLDFVSALGYLETYASEFGTTPEIEKEIAFLRSR